MITRKFNISLYYICARPFVTVRSMFPGMVLPFVKYSEEAGYFVNKIHTNKHLLNKKVMIIGFPGCFTPHSQTKYLPEFISSSDLIISKGIDEILALAVNDPFVMISFAEMLGSEDKISFIADGNGDLTKTLDLGVDLSSGYLNYRARKFILIVNNNKIENVIDEDRGRYEH